jgi:hypothetical protein
MDYEEASARMRASIDFSDPNKPTWRHHLVSWLSGIAILVGALSLIYIAITLPYATAILVVCAGIITAIWRRFPHLLKD